MLFGVLLGSGMLLAACGLARNAAVTSYHVATAPVQLVRRAIAVPDPPVTATTTSSDVEVPGHLVASSTPSRRKIAQASSAAQTKAAPSSRAPAPPADFPVAKPVPGKPGYVYSPSDPNKWVDVSGYTPGSKVKDPYSKKIFVVP
jgi:hypothetical protein